MEAALLEKEEEVEAVEELLSAEQVGSAAVPRKVSGNTAPLVEPSQGRCQRYESAHDYSTNHTVS